LKIRINARDFLDLYYKNITLRRRLNPISYIVCESYRGLELIPLLTSRHLHYFIICCDTNEECEKIKNTLKDTGLLIYKCVAESVD